MRGREGCVGHDDEPPRGIGAPLFAGTGAPTLCATAAGLRVPPRNARRGHGRERDVSRGTPTARPSLIQVPLVRGALSQQVRAIRRPVCHAASGDSQQAPPPERAAGTPGSRQPASAEEVAHQARELPAVSAAVTHARRYDLGFQGEVFRLPGCLATGTSSPVHIDAHILGWPDLRKPGVPEPPHINAQTRGWPCASTTIVPGRCPGPHVTFVEDRASYVLLAHRSARVRAAG